MDGNHVPPQRPASGSETKRHRFNELTVPPGTGAQVRRGIPQPYSTPAGNSAMRQLMHTPAAGRPQARG